MITYEITSMNTAECKEITLNEELCEFDDNKKLLDKILLEFEELENEYEYALFEVKFDIFILNVFDKHDTHIDTFYIES